MNEHVPDSDEFESIERRLKSLRPAEVPSLFQARMQFELGRRQGRREARKAMFAYASAACIAVWAGTTWIERTNSPVSTELIVQSKRSAPDSRDVPEKHVWSLDDIKKLARFEAAVRGDARIGGHIDRHGDSSRGDESDQPDNSLGPWNRRRWLKELMAESAPVSS